MQKLERDSRLRSYLNLHTDSASLVNTLAIRQREEFELHANAFSQLEIFAQEWKEAGMRGVPRWKGGQINERQTLKGISSPEDFLDSLASEHSDADKGAVLLGNIALSLYETAQEGSFSLYLFSARYNNDVQGTTSAELPFIHPDHPDTKLSPEEKAHIENSLTIDPTGAHLIAHPKLWPRELMMAASSPRLEDERKAMADQLPHYKYFAKKVLSENPEAYKPYTTHSDHILEPNVAKQILSALGDF